ncbi:FkbM family methyltransferase [Leptolyngbya sp. 15MV]|nr:FkbM family methyltransferase [Leptolyngbya sp. 15MV]
MKFLLRRIGLLTPNVRYVRSIPPRLLTPIHKFFGLKGATVDVLGSQMYLDPIECVDNGLWFLPHLYDRAERAFIRREARTGVFFDVGANIGFWSLYLARHFRQSRIIAIEANPKTAELLRQNIARNAYPNVEVVETGVGPEVGQFELYLNTTGNRGGDSFVPDSRRSTRIPVQVQRLSDIIRERAVEAIEFMKMDIEGVEEGVLTEMFEHLPEAIWPRFICVETIHSPAIEELLSDRGYSLELRARENAIFQRTPA